MPCNCATARKDREKTAKLVQKTVISSIVCQKTSTENRGFLHSILRKPVRKIPGLFTRNVPKTENKA